MCITEYSARDELRDTDVHLSASVHCDARRSSAFLPLFCRLFVTEAQ